MIILIGWQNIIIFNIDRKESLTMWNNNCLLYYFINNDSRVGYISETFSLMLYGKCIFDIYIYINWEKESIYTFLVTSKWRQVIQLVYCIHIPKDSIYLKYTFYCPYVALPPFACGHLHCHLVTKPETITPFLVCGWFSKV